ncbi:hypothetical protein HK096_000356, partial [Nowakowskiella sp. JEL0078]
MFGNLKQAMENGVRESRLFVPFLCEHYCSSKSCNFEFQLAVKYKTIMLPVRLDKNVELTQEIEEQVNQNLWIEVNTEFS